MKIGRVGAVLLVLAIVAGTGLALAEEGAKDKEALKSEKRQARHAEMIKKYDKDGDGKLSDEERKAMKKSFREKSKDTDGEK
ncbi:MAG: EF-hand domain-containing protein [Kiritimatiellia bacterium]|jgi:Ca2+-binding EF-hand superfamily protein|nr:EF-hand domain-containing protein [Kiritimatiellia bacterium]MDP6847999.1 EF-hand domain-containing protein [Kiritimatiellia bacterium]